MSPIAAPIARSSPSVRASQAPMKAKPPMQREGMALSAPAAGWPRPMSIRMLSNNTETLVNGMRKFIAVSKIAATVSQTATEPRHFLGLAGVCDVVSLNLTRPPGEPDRPARRPAKLNC